MTTEAKTKALLGAIKRRLTDISEQQHALAVEKARLLEALTPLRLGVAAPDTTLAQLRAKGVTLRGLTAAGPRAPRPDTSGFRNVPFGRSSRVVAVAALRNSRRSSDDVVRRQP